MGSAPYAVVDTQLRVTRLRVIDASVMPTIVRAPTNATTIMIDERAATFLRGLRTPREGHRPVQAHSQQCAPSRRPAAVATAARRPTGLDSKSGAIYWLDADSDHITGVRPEW
jgi:GMC oxidoreductase